MDPRRARRVGCVLSSLIWTEDPVMTRERSPDALRNSSTLAFLNAFLIAFAIGLPSSRAIATPISSRPIVGEPAPVESTALAEP